MYLGYSEDQFDLREIKDVRGVACSFEVLRAGMASYAINLTMRGAHLVDSSSREVIDPQYPAILFGANVTGYADPAAHAQVEVVAEPPAEILFAKKAADVDHWLKQREDNPDIAMTQHMELFAA